MLRQLHVVAPPCVTAMNGSAEKPKNKKIPRVSSNSEPKPKDAVKKVTPTTTGTTLNSKLAKAKINGGRIHSPESSIKSKKDKTDTGNESENDGVGELVPAERGGSGIDARDGGEMEELINGHINAYKRKSNMKGVKVEREKAEEKSNSSKQQGGRKKEEKKKEKEVKPKVKTEVPEKKAQKNQASNGSIKIEEDHKRKREEMELKMLIPLKDGKIRKCDKKDGKSKKELVESEDRPIKEWKKKQKEKVVGLKNEVEDEKDGEISGTALYKFPMNRISRIIKSDGFNGRVSQEATFVINKASERFLELFTKEAYASAFLDNKNYVSYDHLSSVVSRRKRFGFLADFVPEKVKVEDALAEMSKSET